jgi:GMP synthase (glutamine-hydrolysing)
MSKPTILAIQNDETDPPHLVGRWLAELGFEVKVIHAYRGELVPNKVPKDVAALMPLGGHMGALDDQVAPWLKAERELLADAVSKDFPIFAICLGAQLLAAATDGKVERMPKSEIGIFEIKSVASDPIVDFGQSAITSQWHEDYVTKLPTGAKLLAASELCTNQIYKMGSHTYAFQSHPEVDGAIVTRWEEDADNAFIESGSVSVKAQIAAAEVDLVKTWKPIVQSWGAKLLSGHATINGDDRASHKG